jgi:flagellar M-ring protein FliF
VAGTQPSFLNQLMLIWSRLQATQRATILLFTVLALAGLGSLVFYMNRVEYVVLYRDLNREDAQSIAAKLRELNRDFRASPDGTMIEVGGTVTDVDKLRLEIAGAGLARSGRVGYEIFDKTQFGMTDFTEQVNYKRALEGELSRTIGSLSEITEARVHLVMPKDSLFEDKKEEAKGSVFVRLKRGKELSKSSIAGIVNLVAGAVQGLRTYNVSVVDEGGNVLSRLPSGDTARSDFESGIQAQIEKDLVSKVTSMLEPVVGKGKVHANASVDLDVNSSEQTEETFNPTPPPVILSHQKSEERIGGATTPSGVPGTRSNQGGTVPQTVAGAPDRSRQSEVTNYEVSKLWRHTVQPKGAIRRLSMAVLLDHKTVYSKAADGQQVAALQPHAKEELDQYRQLVLAAIGFNETRGDTVTLENIPFFSEPNVPEDQTPLPWYVNWQGYLLPAMKYAAFLALFLLAYLLVLRPVRKRIFQIIAASPVLPAGQPRQLGEGAGKAGVAARGGQALSAASTPGAAGALMGGMPAGGNSLDAEIEQELLNQAEMAGVGTRKYDILKRKVVEHVNANPEQVSQLTRTWIQEKSQ